MSIVSAMHLQALSVFTFLGPPCRPNIYLLSRRHMYNAVLPVCAVLLINSTF